MIKRRHIYQNRIASLSLIFIFTAFGGWLAYHANPKNNKQNLEKTGLNGIYLIRVTEIPQVKLKTIKLQVKVIGKIAKKNKLLYINELALFYFDKKLKVPKPGDEMLVKCRFISIPNPENPYQFNYKKFLKYQGIYYQSFVRNPQNVLDTKTNSASFIQNLAYRGNQYLLNLFKQNIKDSTALAVTEALIFGYKEDLPKDLVESYSRTGTLHVLAVSGLHVAVVFLMLANFLWFLDKRRYGVLLKTIIVIVCIWAYCILTGLSPSIIRAGIMISLVLIGKALNRHAHTYNIIAVSAFIILVINPFWLLNVGFQLSFAAVLGIVFLQQYLLPLYVPTNYFFKQIWNIIIISICAQIATFPLSLYYFNQFPNYFLLSNLIIIPLTTMVIYTGIGMVIFSKVSFILLGFSWLTEKLVKLTNYLVVSIEKLPYSFIDGIKLSTLQLILLYICIGSIIYWLIMANKKGLIFFLINFSLLIGVYCFDTLSLQMENHMVIFNIPNQNALIISDGHRSVLISDNLQAEKQMFYIRGWLINKRVWPIYKKISFKKIDSLDVYDKTMDFKLKKGIIYFKGSKLNLSWRNLGYNNIRYSYLLPMFFNKKLNYADNMRNTIYIGQQKSKRLQKKVKYFLSKYHNCVIYDITHKELKN